MTHALPLRLNILSDLHLGQAGLPLPDVKADVVILAGDISRPQAAIAWASQFACPVVYVPGNHEFYGSNLSNTIKALRHYAKGTDIHILDNEEIVIHGVRFVGSTLWTDFNLGGVALRDQSIKEALAFIRDFVRIESDVAPGTMLAPDELEALFSTNREWLQKTLDIPFDGPTVVVTHHAPSSKSIHPRFADSLVNTCFVSNSEYLLSGDRAALWVHGHTHDSFDYTVQGTRVVCNPRGYSKGELNENENFDPNFLVEVKRA